MTTPTIIKILTHFRVAPGKVSSAQLAAIISEEYGHVNRVLDKLVSLTVIVEDDGLYHHPDTPTNREFFAKLVEVYDAVDRKRGNEVLARGLMCEIPSRYLFHLNTFLEMMEEEGISRQDSQELLQRDIELGYLRRVRIARLGIRPHPLPKYIPSYWFSHLRMFKWDEYLDFRQDSDSSAIQEGDYLTRQYPPELVRMVQERLGRRREEIREKLHRKGLLDHPGRFW